MTDLLSYSDDPPRGLDGAAAGEPGPEVFSTVFDRGGVRAARLDHKLRLTEVSDDFAREFGLTAGQMRGSSLAGLLHPSVRVQVAQQLARLFDGQRQRFVEWVLALRADKIVGAELTGIAVHGPAGRVESLMVLLRPERSDPGVVVSGDSAPLSPMHARILEGVAAGASTVQLSTQLFLSCGGVDYHLTALLRAMGVPNRSALVSKAYAMGLFCVGSWPPRVLPEYVGRR